jgi:hypothetical protein
MAGTPRRLLLWTWKWKWIDGGINTLAIKSKEVQTLHSALDSARFTDVDV